MRLGSDIPRGAALTAGRDISSEACGFQLLLLIPIGLNSRHERAYAQLAAQAGPDMVTDVAVQEEWNWALVGTLYCTKLQAKAVRIAPPPPPPAPPVTAPLPEAAPPVGTPSPTPESAPPSMPVPPAGATTSSTGVVPSAPPPATPPAGGLAVGGQAHLRAGAQLRARSLPDADAVPGVDSGTTLTLKAVLKKDTGAWWYVTSPSGSGWVLDTDLVAP